MTKTLTRSEFTAEFHRMGRGDQFSHKALLALFDYLEQYENDTGEQIELDVIALCCEYTEYENIDELNKDYATNFTTQTQVADHTAIIPMDGTEAFIIQNYL